MLKPITITITRTKIALAATCFVVGWLVLCIVAMSSVYYSLHGQLQTWSSFAGKCLAIAHYAHGITNNNDTIIMSHNSLNTSWLHTVARGFRSVSTPEEMFVRAYNDHMYNLISQKVPVPESPREESVKNLRSK